MKPCDICLEKECKAKNGPGTCNCETCAVREECPKKLRAVIRLTLKCTQTCEHCCFDCSPKNDTHMTIESARKIAQFLEANEIQYVNIMGGEVFCNPDWKEIIDIIVPVVKQARIVSNGDWAVVHPEFAEHISKHENCYVSVSKDRWHTNKNIEVAEQLLIKNNVIVKVSDLNETESNLVPIGRAEYSGSMFSMFGCYCHNPQHQYSFMIDEEGNIYKCGFGVWNYAHVDEYITGGFAERFKELNKRFYNIFIPSCSSCIRSYKFSK